MRPLAAAAILLMVASAARADGPPLALLRLDGATTTLTAPDLPALPDADTELSLSFAQRHLGFPLPPRLDIVLRASADGWQVMNLRLERTSAELPVVLDPGSARVVTTEGEGLDLRLVVRAEAMALSGTAAPEIVPVEIEIILRSP